LFTDHNIQLCKRLGDEDCGVCMGIVGHDNDIFHLHPVIQKRQDVGKAPITLDHILSHDFAGHISRRQRYLIALLVASSVGQLQFTPWLRTGLCKEDIIFFPSNDDSPIVPYGEPFIRQNHHLRKKHPSTTDAATKHAFDVMAALRWSSSVSGEGGDDYATAVKWCFTGVTDTQKNWRGEIVANVVRPLEKCMDHFQAAAV
ncbi:uncharacterized protein M421DRAFT_22857, partial [Didymella exigua CBS 183.55]